MSLAAWDMALIAAGARAARLPSGTGWMEPEQMAKYWGMAVESTEARLRKMCARGVAERFRGSKPDREGKIRIFTWYRLKAKP